MVDLQKIKFGKAELIAAIRKDYNFSNSYLFKDNLNLQIDAGNIFNEKIDFLVLTHCHFDHIAYASEIKKRNSNCKIMCGKNDAEAIEKLNEVTLSEMSSLDLKPVKIDKKLKEGDIIKTNNFKFLVLETPGHTKGSISLFEKEKGILISGDCWFGDDIYGNYMVPTGSKKELEFSIKKLKELKAKIILAGHDSLIFCK